MTIIDLMRSRLLDNPADEELVQLRIELNDASDWLKSLARMPVEVRSLAISFPSTLENEEDVTNSAQTVMKVTTDYAKEDL